MDNPSDEDIAEALRLQGDVGIVTVEDVREYAKLGAGWAKDTLAHSSTIDQRNKLVEALEPFANLADELDTGPYNWDDDQFVVNGIKAGDARKARQVITQFRSGQ